MDEWVDVPDSFGALEHIGLWDTSQITDFSYVFWEFNPNLRYFDEDLSLWDLSNAVTTACMFWGCSKFRGRGLSQWNVRNVTNMMLCLETAWNSKETCQHGTRQT